MLAILALPGAAAAATIAHEDFSYAYGELAGQNGGFGFAGAWTANAPLTEVANPGTPLTYAGGTQLVDGGAEALRITGNNDNIAFRTLAAPISLDQVFISFLFRYDGALDNNDFGVIWNDNASTGSHTDRPNLGIKANRGDGSGPQDVVARLQLAGTGQVYAIDLLAGQTYFILGRLYKTTPGAANNYDRFDIWVDPTSGASGTPDLTASGPGNISSFGTIGVRTANIDLLDSFWIDELRYASTYGSATAPEPSTALLVGCGLVILAARRQRQLRRIRATRGRDGRHARSVHFQHVSRR